MPGSPRREALLVTEAAARQGPRGIDARVPSHTERRRGAGYDFFERERHGRKPPVRSTYPLSAHSTRIALMLYPSPMPVTSAVRFVSWCHGLFVFESLARPCNVKDAVQVGSWIEHNGVPSCAAP